MWSLSDKWCRNKSWKLNHEPENDESDRNYIEYNEDEDGSVDKDDDSFGDDDESINQDDSNRH